jgi:hypothetical protein
LSGQVESGQEFSFVKEFLLDGVPASHSFDCEQVADWRILVGNLFLNSCIYGAEAKSRNSRCATGVKRN